MTSGSPIDFAAVDTGDAGDLVAMMDATDAWPGVVAARAWVLEQVAPTAGRRAVVVDAGCGSGTFGGAVDAAGLCAVDLDRSAVMLGEARRRRPRARVVLGDAGRLPLRTGSARLVRAERVLQWTADPSAVLAELWRVTGPGGWLAVTDTDWGTLSVGLRGREAAARLAAAALRWVPNPRLAAGLAAAVAALGPAEVRARTDTVVLGAWDPDDPAQAEGPPGLPLRSIAAAAPAGDRAALGRDLAALAGDARNGRFSASLSLVTAVARRQG